MNTKQLVQRSAGIGRQTVRHTARLARRGASFALGKAERVARGSRGPKPGMDDATLKAKVETVLFRPADAPKSGVTIGVVDGVVELRGTARTAKQIRDLERRAREIPEVRDVENLLSQRKTPARTRTSARTGSRSRSRSGAAKAGASGTTAATEAGTTGTPAAPEARPVEATATDAPRPATPTSEPRPRARDVLGVLARQEDSGEHVSEAEIGRELDLDATEVADILRGLTTTNLVVRTATGNWELTPAARSEIEPRPHPKEPQAT